MPNTLNHNPHLVYRPDIDGLRAIAIVLVIVFHAFPKLLRGGFIGVDIFFVISGYLITGIILKGLTRDNFSLLEFYSRRIKRIFPALIVVLSFCLIAGWYVLLGDEFEVLGKHIAAGSIYISNFILQGEAGYFDTDAELKPLLHLWSLAVEEQFYLFFPLLLMLSHKLRINALGVIVVGFTVSFVLNISQITDKPTEVFFFPQSRIWELLVGSTVAYISLRTHLLKRKTQKMSNVLSIFGVSLIIFAWIYLDSKKIFFPYFWALLPTLGAACLILAGEKAWFNRKFLASKIAIFIGLISYPLYLWHWVLLSFIQITEIDKPKPLLKISLLFLSILAAWLTYFFVEKNIRFLQSKFVSLGLLTALLLIGTTGYAVYDNKGYVERFNFEQKWTEGELGTDIFMKQGLVAQRSCIDKYQNFFEKPKNREELLDYEFCLMQNNDKAPTALLFGDSHANHLYFGLAANTNLTGGNLLNLGLGGCYPFVNLHFQEEKCQKIVEGILKMVVDTSSIKTVIITSRTFSQKGIPGIKKIYGSEEGMDNADFMNILKENMKVVLIQLLKANKNIIFILDTPALNFSPESCIERPWRLTGLAFKEPCAIPRIEVDNVRQKYLSAVTDVLLEFPTIKIYDPLEAFCNESYCWAIKNGKMLYRDNGHLSKVGAIYLGEYFQKFNK